MSFLDEYGSQIGPSIAGAALNTSSGVASTGAGGAAAMNPAAAGFGAGLLIGSIVFGSIARRKAKRRAEAQKRQGTVSIETPLTARRRIYGEARVEAEPKYWVTHGPNQEFVSIVYLVAEHECDSIVDIQFDNESIGPLDGDGDVQAGSKWFKSTPLAAVQNVAAVSGTITLPTVTAAMPGLSLASGLYPGYVPPFGTNDSGFVELTPGVDFTHTVGTNTITLAGALAGQSIAAGALVANWQSATNLALARVRKFLGAVPQTADATLIYDSGGEWSSTCRLDGQTYLIVRLRWDERIGAGKVPRVHVIARGVKVYDPRTATTAWSANWALCVRDYIKHVSKCADSEFDSADLTDSANVSDELVQAGPAKTITTITKAAQGVATIPGHGFLPGDVLRFTVTGMTGLNGHDIAIASIVDASTVVLAENTSGYGTFTGGTVIAKVRRYEVHGEIRSTDDPIDKLEDMVLSGGGAIVPTAGVFRILCGKYRTPVSISLSDRDLAGPAIEVLPYPSDDETFNSVSGTFFDARQVGGTRLYSETSYAPYESSAYKTEDGDVELKRRIDFPFTRDYRVANRLAKQAMHRARQGLRFTAPYKLNALPLQPGDVVQGTHVRYGFSGKVFEVLRVAYRFPHQVVLTLQETAAAAFDPDYSEAAFVDPAPNTMLADPTEVARPLLTVHASASVAPITIDTLADGSRVPYVLVSWPARTNASEYVSIRWKRSFETAYRTVDARPGETSVKLFGPSGGDVLQILGYAVNSINARSDPWTVQAFFVDDELPRYNGVLPALSANLIKNATLDVSAGEWTTFAFGGVPASVVVVTRHADPTLRIAGSPSSIYVDINSALAGNAYAAGVLSAAFSVEPNQPWCGYASLSPFATDARVYLRWYDAAGGELSQDPGTVVTARGSAAWSDPSTYGLSVVFATAPAGARTGRLVVAAEGNWLSARKYVSIHKPFAGVVPLGSVDVPVWSPGGSNIVDETTIKPGAMRRLDRSPGTLSGFIPTVPRDTLYSVGDAALIVGDFDGTGLRVLITVTGNVEQWNDGTAAPFEIRGVIEVNGASSQRSPQRVIAYLVPPVVTSGSFIHKAGFEISHQFVLPAPFPASGDFKYSFVFYGLAPVGTANSLISFRDVVINFDIAR